MSDPTPQRAPLVSILAIFALFALFAIVVYYVYVPRQTGVFIGNGLITPEQRIKNLADLRAKEAAASTSYAWIDQKAGVVQLPLSRAQELTLQRYAPKK